jgi:hypothetical protein
MAEELKKPGEQGDVIKLRGCYEIGLYDAVQGTMVAYRKVDNVVVTSGRSYVLSRLVGGGSAQTDVITSIEVGTSTSGPASTDTLLIGTYATAANTGRLTIASWVVGGLGSSPPFWQAQVTFATNQANTTLGEAGIFNATGYNASTMLSRVTFATISKQTSNTLAISYTISN